MGRSLWTVVAILGLLIVGIYVIDTFRQGGAFREVVEQVAGTCTPVTGMVGVEDLEIDHATGQAFLSAHDRRTVMAGTRVDGAIYRLDVADANAQPIVLDVSLEGGFFPHGLSLYQDGDVKRLFVINHARANFGKAGGTHTIEIFDITADGLTHVETVADPGFNSPNDLVAVGPRQFYISNDHGSKTDLGRTAEAFLQLPRASVVYYDGQTGTELVTGLHMANGVNVSPDGKRFYVVETLGDRGLHVFDRDPATGNLALMGQAFLATNLDNIDVDADGNLWIGAHINLFDFLSHVGDPEALSAGQVIKVSFGENDQASVDQIYQEKGALLSGLSVAANHGDVTLVGSVFEPHILRCTGLKTSAEMATPE